MMAYQSVALVILNYNGKNYLERFLPSVLTYAPPGAQIVLGDNASTDDSVPFVASAYPAVTIIKLDRNLGFADGYNQVLKQVKADIFFLLNSDIELRESTAPLIDALQQDDQIAAVQPKILSYHQSTYFEHAGGAGGWIDALGYPFCKGRILDFFEEDKGQYDQSEEIFWASGAAMVVRAEIFHRLGGFDARYFAHMEEIDWCWRAKLTGLKIMSVPKVAVYHIGGGTLPYRSNQKILLNFRNNLATLLKNESTLKLIYLIPVRMGLDLMAAISFFLKANIGAALAVFKAYLTILAWLPYLFKQRRVVQSMAKGKNFNSNGIYHGSLIWQYFVLGKKKFYQIIPPHV